MLRDSIGAVFVACAALFSSGVVVGQVIVDNDGGGPGYVETPAWSTSGATGYNGGTYRFASVGTTATATWTGTLPTTQNYEVFIWYVPGSNRASSTKYIINAADGPHTVFVNQKSGGLTWDTLGTYPFNAGSASVVLESAGSSGGTVIIADAVRFGGDGGPPIDPPDPVEVAPGVFHSIWELPQPQVNHVLEFDLADPQYTIEMGFAQGQRYYTAKEPVSVIAGHYDEPGHEVVAAINASFFEAGLGILGMLGSGGNLISSRAGTPGLEQTYMLEQSGEGWAGSAIPTANMVARFANSTEVQINVLDYTCSGAQILLYTPDWGPSTKSTAIGAEIIIEDVNFPLRPNKWLTGRIAAVKTAFFSLDNPIPPDGLVLAACGGTESVIVPHAVVGEEISIRFSMQDRLANLQTLVTGNVWIVKDGVAFHPGEAVRHPRTVIAWSGTKHWFVTFDGRQPGYSVGASTAEEADFLINALGVENAINLDGGGSTTMVINGDVVNCPSDNAGAPCTGVERADPNALLLIRRTPTSVLPMSDSFTSSGRFLPWDDKFSMNPVVPFAPAAPNGDGHVLHVHNPDGAFETCSVGRAGDTNYITEASVFLDYRPELAADGFERVGIFARDDGNANFDSTTLNGGNCYALTVDSHDGRVRAGKIVEGVFTDFLASSPVHVTSSGWRRMRIDTIGTTVRYFLDGAMLISAVDTTHAHGRPGIGHHTFYATAANNQGAHAENFIVRGLQFDTDNDGDVDLIDLNWFTFCLRGPLIVYSPSAFCKRLDGDGDGDVDLADFELLQNAYTGPL